MGRKQQKHATVEKTEQRDITRVMCAQRGCKFFGQEAQQGVCHTTDGDLVDWARLDAHEKELLAELAEMKVREGKKYVRVLEAHYLAVMMNWKLTLDECIRLRRDITLARSR